MKEGRIGRGAQAKCEGNMMVEAEGRGNKGGEFAGGVTGKHEKRCDRERKQTEKNSSVPYTLYIFTFFI